MAIYSLALAGTIAVPQACLWELKASATDRAVVLAIEINLDFPAVGKQLTLGRPKTLGVGGTGIALLAEDPASPAGTATAAVAGWTVYPTPPDNFIRRATLTTTQVWYFPTGLVVPAGGNLAVYQGVLTGAAANFDITCVIDE